MCDIIEFQDDKFRITYDGYQSEYYSDLKELRLYDISILRNDIKYSGIPYSLYILKKFANKIIDRFSVQFKIDKNKKTSGEYWIIRNKNEISIKWAVFDYEINYLFINDLMKCGVLDIVSAIDMFAWRDLDYENKILPWINDRLNEYCRKNIDLQLSALNESSISIIWDYIICKFDDIEF